MGTATTNRILGALVGGVALLTATGAMALPALQLGAGSGATFDGATQTWVFNTDPFTVNAYANATTGNGQYAWDTTSETRTAYLVFAATPKAGNGPGPDLFDISVTGVAGAVSFWNSGYGSAPASDPNGMAPHSIFDTYYEIYEFVFDGPVVQVEDQQPPLGGGTGDGYEEGFNVAINSLAAGVTGIHIDLFTLSSDNPGEIAKFAPFSHDAEWEQTEVSAPATLGLFGLALAGLGIAARRRKQR